MKIFSWALIVVGFLVVVGAVNDPAGEKPLDQIVFWVMVGLITIVTGWLTGSSWERRNYESPSYYVALGILLGAITAWVWYVGEWADNAITTNHIFTLAAVMVLYGIGLLAAMAIRDRVKLERS
ncbi:MAG: hypothetical protein UY56_C0008G0009 [Parcubacteria group bacterium GW2011_GWA1_50_14]|uniref:Uncharacterized protein n=1 Tax=Candidatus Liptonbacteria bacterium GWB1_49_6 TaxID=1798644 RepID=A0A1G2C562_9BACT|nr:MAG: hypothetical protein UY56_C0008G0009 [Parcubacteria group bacterium GW2011_GWA1_50_14]OGY96554.1 MAG: hypothetical protein A2122_02495 [Candidatus Liptonbacteria bacterium GWB1_49_6]